MKAAAILALVLLPFAAGAATFPGHPTTSPEITAADLSARDKALADDAFEGRGPGTVNGEAAADWIAAELGRIGIAPANHGSYFQSVPAVSITLDRAHSHYAIQTPKGMLTPKMADDVMYWTSQFAAPDVTVKNSDLVFVGYGVVAPEYHWNDYAGIDVKGKTVVVLINDPGNEAAHPDPKFFKGKAMTYYGRWTYKFEEAAREAADQGKSLSAIQSWITHETAIDLFHRAGLDYYALKAAANRPGFKAVPMTGESLSATAHSSVTHMKTRNVLGMIAGTKNPGDVFVYSAHWDHLGRKDNAPGPDKIFNGAV